jgi:hypothetical protein
VGADQWRSADHRRILTQTTDVNRCRASLYVPLRRAALPSVAAATALVILAAALVAISATVAASAIVVAFAV